MRKLLWLLSSVALMSLEACSLAPTYERPALELDQQWPLNPSSQNSVAQLNWERLYPDARLQALIRAALERNHDLRIAVARQQQARALWGVQKADQWPAVTIDVSGNGTRIPSGIQGNPSALELKSETAGLSLLSYEVDLWGRVANLTDIAKANFVASEEDRRTVYLGLISDVANAYWQLQELQERFALAHQTEQTRADSLHLTQAKRDAGSASDWDVLASQASLAAAQADAASLDRQQQQASNALKLLLGGQWPANLPAPVALSEQVVPMALMADLPSEVLLRRPDVRSAEQKLIAANANIGVARAAYLPKISLTGSFGSASTSMSSLFTSGSRDWSFSPAVSAPLFDSGHISSTVEAAKAQQVQAVAAYEKTIYQAFREVADLLVAQSTLKAQWQAQNEATQSQVLRLQMVEKRYALGSASQLELLDAQRDAYAAQQALLQVRRQMFANTALLYKALGGGNEPQNTAQNS